MLPSDLAKYKEKSQKIIALTAWDCISGSLAEQANADIVLVGDSLAMVCLGYKSTLPITLENIIYHTKQHYYDKLCFLKLLAMSICILSRPLLMNLLLVRDRHLPVLQLSLIHI